VPQERPHEQESYAEVDGERVRVDRLTPDQADAYVRGDPIPEPEADAPLLQAAELAPTQSSNKAFWWGMATTAGLAAVGFLARAIVKKATAPQPKKKRKRRLTQKKKP
jgi:hypothetical protein